MIRLTVPSVNNVIGEEVYRNELLLFPLILTADRGTIKRNLSKKWPGQFKGKF